MLITSSYCLQGPDVTTPCEIQIDVNRIHQKMVTKEERLDNNSAFFCVLCGEILVITHIFLRAVELFCSYNALLS